MKPLALGENFSVVIPIVAGIGNALMATPMVRHLKQQRPGARIKIVAQIGAMAEPFRRLDGAVDEIFVTGKDGTARGIFWTQKQRADLYLIPFPSNRWQYNLLAAASAAGAVVMHEYPFGKLRTLSMLARAHRVPAQRGIHDVFQNLRLLEQIGIDIDSADQAPRFALTEGDRQRGAVLLRSVGLTEESPFVAIHAGSAKTVLAQSKRWPPRLYARLIEMIRDEVPHKIVLLEGPDETGVADEILAATKSRDSILPLRLTGPLGDAAAVLERAAVYIGSDSGLAHLAGAVGTPPVTLFAPADPDRVSPFGFRHLVVTPPCDCCPSFLYPWQATKPKLSHSRLCIEAIDPQSVMSKVREAINFAATSTSRGS